ncbi:c-type cytochrome [SAR92 clade bacterium H455]|uniref:C-type cytochrome n=1 Tax=SAR92 clade bacterium H455 TaxID=2974818 RepID=A0ABY5TLG4_9GAMM|nr:c-type cytochrome [SAR92 clade bacterium H455]
MNTIMSSRLKNLVLITIASAVLWGCGSADKTVNLTANQEQQVAARIAPAGHVSMAGQVVTMASAGAESARAGGDIYAVNCVACHSSGVAGAPKMGDVAAWSARLEQGLETVYTNAINGIRGMPMRGTCMDCSDDEVKAAVDHILEGSK